MWTITTFYLVACMFGATVWGNAFISGQEIEKARQEQEKTEQVEDGETSPM
jgi:hypothetical protein